MILLHQLYSLSGSHDLIFQGGTALRWCYGGSRFSEDLDFVTPLAADAVRTMVERALRTAEKVMAPHFGPGALTLSDRSTRQDTLKMIVDYRPETSREKISIKLEFEGIRKNSRPDTRNYILSALPAVSYLIASGDFRMPRPNAVLVGETAEEILSDKIRALLERRYLKGRDIYDVWYLRSVLNVAAGKELIERKFSMYAWPFQAARGLDFFAEPTGMGAEELKTAIRQDLSRFLPPETFSVQEQEGFAPFLDALCKLFTELREAKVRLP